jgi:hypothetical protein
MSFDQLMRHAHDIQATAVAKALDEKGVRAASKPGDPSLAPQPGEETTRAGVIADFADIPSLFEPFTMMPDPASFNGLSEKVGDAMRYLSPGHMNADPITGAIYLENSILTRIGPTESYVAHWTGDAADAFLTDLVYPFPALATNQFISCAVLRGALAAQQALWISARDHIDQVAHKTLAALDNMGHCGQNTWTMTWTIVASVAAVAAVPISAGASLTAALAVTAVGAAGQVAAAHQVAPPKETEYHGETAVVVIEQMRHGVNQAISEIQQGEQTILAALRNMHAAVTQHPGNFVAPRPKLLDATPRSVFDDRYLGHAR